MDSHPQPYGDASLTLPGLSPPIQGVFSYQQGEAAPRWLLYSVFGLVLFPLACLPFIPKGSIPGLPLNPFDMPLHTILNTVWLLLGYLTVGCSVFHYRFKEGHSNKNSVSLVLGLILLLTLQTDSAMWDVRGSVSVGKLPYLQQAIAAVWAIGQLFHGVLWLLGGWILYQNSLYPGGKPGSGYGQPSFSRIQGGLLSLIFATLVIQLGMGLVLNPSPEHPLGSIQALFHASPIPRPWDIPPILLTILLLTVVFPKIRESSKSPLTETLVLAYVPFLFAEVYMAFFSQDILDFPYLCAYILRISTFVILMLGLILDFIQSLHHERMYSRNLIQRLEEVSQRQKDTEVAASMKAQYFTKILEEMRFPLHGIMGISAVLANSDLNGEQRRLVGVVQQAVQSLFYSIHTVQDVSKLEQGTLVLEPQGFELREVLGEISLLMSKSAAERNIELLLHIDPQCPEHVVGDPARIRQLFTHMVGYLLDLKGYPASPQLTHAPQGMETFWIKIEEALDEYGSASEEQSQNPSKLISPPPMGEGVPITLHCTIALPQGLSCSFQELKQVETSTPQVSLEPTAGALGLFIAQALIDHMNGHFWSESWADLDPQGSDPLAKEVIHFTLQLQRSKLPLEPWALFPLDALQGKNALVLDPNLYRAASIIEHLQHWGMNAKACETYEEALELLHGKREPGQKNKVLWDVVILDGQFQPLGLDGQWPQAPKETLEETLEVALGESDPTPTPDGFQLAKTLRAESGLGKNLKILLYSTLHLADLPERIEHSGINALIPKPFNPRHLLTTLLALMNSPNREIRHFPRVPSKALRNALGSQKSIHVLVVDDNFLTQETLKLYFERLDNHQLTLANTGAEGIKVLQTNLDQIQLSQQGEFSMDILPIHVILIDLDLPDGSGLAIGQEMAQKLQEAGVQIPILGILNASSTEVREACLSQGFQGFLTKPFNKTEFLETIYGTLLNTGYLAPVDGLKPDDPVPVMANKSAVASTSGMDPQGPLALAPHDDDDVTFNELDEDDSEEDLDEDP